MHWNLLFANFAPIVPFICTMYTAFNKAVKKQEDKNGIVVDENNMVSIFLSADDSKDEATPAIEDEDVGEDKGMEDEQDKGENVRYR